MVKRLIKYIGKKPQKIDNVNIPSSQAVWNGPDDVQAVEEKFCPSLLKFPTVWQDVTNAQQGQSGAGLESKPNPNGLQGAQNSGDGSQGGSASQPPQGDGNQSTVVEFSEDKTTAIKQAIQLLDPKSEDHFTGSGVPQVKAIERLLGYDISAADRDAAWSELNEGKK